MIGEKKEGLLCYNDFELLYLAKEDSIEAREIILEKYKMLVFRLIKTFNVEVCKKEDYLQEGLIIINKAIDLYDINSKMTFTRFTEMLIYRRFIDMYRKKKKEELMPIEKIDYFFNESESLMLREEQNYEYGNMSKFEYLVFKLKYEDNLSPKDISEKLNVDVKKVYSAVDRIKKKRKIN